MLRRALAYLGVLFVGTALAAAAMWALVLLVDTVSIDRFQTKVLLTPPVLGAILIYPLLKVAFNARGRVWVYLGGLVLLTLVARLILTERFVVQQAIDGYLPILVLVALFTGGFWFCERLVFTHDVSGARRTSPYLTRRDGLFFVVLVACLALIGESFATDYTRAQPTQAIDLQAGGSAPPVIWSMLVNGESLRARKPAGTPCSAPSRSAHPFARLEGLVEGQTLRLDWRQPAGAIRWGVGLSARWDDGRWACGWSSNGASIVVAPAGVAAGDVLIELEGEARDGVGVDVLTLSVCRTETSCRRLDLGGDG